MYGERRRAITRLCTRASLLSDDMHLTHLYHRIYQY